MIDRNCQNTMHVASEITRVMLFHQKEKPGKIKRKKS